jgi:hypothetical protein
VSLLGDGELAVSEGVPELDGAVARTGDDLSVVGREGNGENIVGVSDKASGGGTGGKLPQTESLVPRCRKSICSVRGNDLYLFSASIPYICHCTIEITYAVGNDVRVTVERSLWVAVGALVAGQVPDDQ